MSDLEQQLASLQIDHHRNASTSSIKKVGPAVPPKPKKPQPQVPQSYSIKTPPMPSYSTVLNNTGTPQKVSNFYANSPLPYQPSPDASSVNNQASKFYKNTDNFYQNNEHLYTNETIDKSYASEKNFYSNIGNIAEPQVPVDERSTRGTTRDVVYSNIEPAAPIPVPAPTNDRNIIYSNIQWNNKPENTYSNIPSSQNHELVDDLPPPPPEPTEYISCIAGNFPAPPDELPPPPSPVSSSYSELRRANYQPEYPSTFPDIYAPSSQSSSTYESIYEPINPRPPSQLSCNYSMYSGYGGPATSSTQPLSSSSQTKVTPVKEVEVLTDLLVQGMEDSQDDIYGICVECGGKVESEGTGCSAMDKIFHINCFCCFICRVNLQGKSFYSLEGKPYCENDYLNTLEKCCVCTRPILDRILRATGKPYHPSCFACVVCGQSLDGIQFTVDATNQIHCIQCFHKKFAPRCCVCKLPIMPELGQDETVRVVALDRSFHITCYKCEDCGLVLSSDDEGQRCYPLDDHVLCKSCNAKRVQALTSHIKTTEL